MRSNMAAADSIDAAPRSLTPQEQRLLSGRRVSAGSPPQGQTARTKKLPETRQCLCWWAHAFSPPV
jgi:hypothetical protein